MTQAQMLLETGYEAFIVVAKSLKGQSLKKPTCLDYLGFKMIFSFLDCFWNQLQNVLQSPKQLGIQASLRQEKRKRSSFLFSISAGADGCDMFRCVLPQLVFSSARQEALRPTGPACLCSGITSYKNSAEWCWDALQPFSLCLKKTYFI